VLLYFAHLFLSCINNRSFCILSVCEIADQSNGNLVETLKTSVATNFLYYTTIQTITRILCESIMDNKASSFGMSFCVALVYY